MFYLLNSCVIKFENVERRFIFVVYSTKKWCVFTKMHGKRRWKKVPFCEIFDIFANLDGDFYYPPIAMEICKMAEINFFDYAG